MQMPQGLLDPAVVLGAAGLGVSLQLIHIYIGVLKRTLQVGGRVGVWAVTPCWRLPSVSAAVARMVPLCACVHGQDGVCRGAGAVPCIAAAPVAAAALRAGRKPEAQGSGHMLFYVVGTPSSA